MSGSISAGYGTCSKEVVQKAVCQEHCVTLSEICNTATNISISLWPCAHPFFQPSQDS